MANDGYVQLWRKSLESSVWQNHNLWRFWTYCLIKASYKEHKQMVGFQEVILQPGQFIFGLQKASEETGLSVRNIRTCLEKLQSMENLTRKTTSKFSIISIVNWNEYQGEATSKATSKRQASDKQTTTNNKGNKGNKDIMTANDFNDFLNSLRDKYPELDIDNEWERCQLWWRESGKEMKRPRSAFLNWLEKGKRIQDRSNGNGSHQRSSTRLPTKYTPAPYDPELDEISIN